MEHTIDKRTPRRLGRMAKLPPAKLREPEMSELGEALLPVALIVVAFAIGAAIEALVTIAGSAEWAGTVRSGYERVPSGQELGVRVTCALNGHLSRSREPPFSFVEPL